MANASFDGYQSPSWRMGKAVHRLEFVAELDHEMERATRRTTETTKTTKETEVEGVMPEGLRGIAIGACHSTSA